MNHRQLPDAGLIPHHLLDQLYTLFTTGQLRLQSDGFHCDVCGAQPPWRCECHICRP